MWDEGNPEEQCQWHAAGVPARRHQEVEGKGGDLVCRGQRRREDQGKIQQEAMGARVEEAESEPRDKIRGAVKAAFGPVTQCVFSAPSFY